MHILTRIVKDKLFYVVLLIVVVINTAMRHNESEHPDLLAEYYHPEIDSVDSMNFTALAEIKTLRDSLIDYAVQFKGLPYKYAAKGPGAFDCSGFTCYVFKNFNVALPASSILQAQFGESIDTDAVSKGDLLVFKSPTKGVNRVGHVGIVTSNVDGRVSFIHSSTHRGVVEDTLSNKYYNARFMGARRVLKD